MVCVNFLHRAGRCRLLRKGPVDSTSFESREQKNHDLNLLHDAVPGSMAADMRKEGIV